MAQTAGYSGKPLAQKLGLKDRIQAGAIAAPEQYDTLIDGFPVEHFTDPETLDGGWAFLHLFCRTTADLEAGLAPLFAHLAEGGMIWVSWPKKSSKLWQDMTEDDVRRVALPMGLVDVKVCAVDADWSGLKLMRRKKR